MVIIKPWLLAVDMEMMFACQEKYLLTLLISLKADSAHPVRVLLNHCLDRDLPKDFLSYTHCLLNFFIHVLIIKSFECCDIHAVNRSLMYVRVVQALIFHNAFPLVVPVNKVQVVPSCWVELHGHVLLHSLVTDGLPCISVSWRGPGGG